MSATVDDVFTYLEEHGLAAGSTGWSLLRRREMDSPAADQLVVVSEDGGGAPEFPASAGLGDSALSDPAVLVQVRGNPNDSDGSLEKANEIQAALHGLRNVMLGGSGATLYYRVISQTPEPIWAGFDDRSRPRHNVSFRLLRDV